MYKNVYKYDDMKRAEHMAVRSAAGWYLYTHQLLEVNGEDAMAFLDGMFPNNIEKLAVSRARYTTMLNEKGQIIDDVVIFRMDEKKYWISTLYLKRMLPWFNEHKGAMRVEFTDVTGQWDMYAVQGPKSLDVVNKLLETPVDGQKFFQILDNKLGGIPVKVNRGGFTGEKLGYEIYVAPQHTKELIAQLRALEEQFGIKQLTDIQVMVWTLPTEKGYCLMCDLHWANPFEVGLDRGIDWDKEFVGKEALLKIREEGARRTLLGVIVDREDIYIPAKNLGGPGCPVLFEGQEVGRVTKMTYSFCMDKNIGYALVDSGKVKPGDMVTMRGFEGQLTDKVFF